MRKIRRWVREPGTSWYLCCVGTGIAIFYHSGSWVYVGGVFFLYVVAYMLMLAEYNNGAQMAINRQNEAMEKVMEDQKEWWEKFHADSEAEVASTATRNGNQTSSIPN